MTIGPLLVGQTVTTTQVRVYEGPLEIHKRRAHLCSCSSACGECMHLRVGVLCQHIPYPEARQRVPRYPYESWQIWECSWSCVCLHWHDCSLCLWCAHFFLGFASPLGNIFRVEDTVSILNAYFFGTVLALNIGFCFKIVGSARHIFHVCRYPASIEHVQYVEPVR